MSLLGWLCGPCMSDTRSMEPDVSKVTVLPTPGGTLVAVNEAGVGSEIPCLTRCTLVQAVIVTETSHDLWDPLGSSVPCRV